MILFKTKNIVVAAGGDVGFLQNVVMTTEGGLSVGLPLAVFKTLFEPENDDAKDWIKAFENRLAKPFEYEAEMVPGEDGRMKLRAKGKSP